MNLSTRHVHHPHCNSNLKFQEPERRPKVVEFRSHTLTYLCDYDHKCSQTAPYADRQPMFPTHTAPLPHPPQTTPTPPADHESNPTDVCAIPFPQHYYPTSCCHSPEAPEK